MKDSPFFEQAKLMLRVLPHVVAEDCFALKGGTAINLFVRDMPRLSVDVDLTYLPIEPRTESLRNIEIALQRIAKAIRKANPRIRVQESVTRRPEYTVKLFVADHNARIKIEPNTIVRGSVFPCEERALTKKAEDLFELSVSAVTLSIADLFGGKLCAALDRQYPRDIFDIKVLLENEGITDQIRKAFIVYLSSHSRPMNELIDPVRQDRREIYEGEFLGMVAVPIKYQDLLAAREQFIEQLISGLTDEERRFLVSVKEGEPDWKLIGIEGLEKLPAIQWKLMNIRKMDKQKHRDSLKKLKAKLGL